MRIRQELTERTVLSDVGDRLARHRLDLNLTQAQLAREAGVSKRTVVRLEHGDSTQLTNLVRVLRALGLLANFNALVPPPLTSPLAQLESEGAPTGRPDCQEIEAGGQVDLG